MGRSRYFLGAFVAALIISIPASFFAAVERLWAPIERFFVSAFPARDAAAVFAGLSLGDELAFARSGLARVRSFVQRRRARLDQHHRSAPDHGGGLGLALNPG